MNIEDYKVGDKIVVRDPDGKVAEWLVRSVTEQQIDPNKRREPKMGMKEWYGDVMVTVQERQRISIDIPDDGTVTEENLHAYLLEAMNSRDYNDVTQAETTQYLSVDKIMSLRPVDLDD